MEKLNIEELKSLDKDKRYQDALNIRYQEIRINKLLPSIATLKAAKETGVDIKKLYNLMSYHSKLKREREKLNKEKKDKMDIDNGSFWWNCD